MQQTALKQSRDAHAAHQAEDGVHDSHGSVESRVGAGQTARSYDRILDGLTAPATGVSDGPGAEDEAPGAEASTAPVETEEKEGEEEEGSREAKASTGKKGEEKGALAPLGGPTGGSVSQGDGMLILDGTESPTVQDPEPAGDDAPVDLTIASTVTFAGTVRGGFAAPAFGQMNPTITFTGFTFSRSGNTVTLTGSITGDFQWGVNAGGRTDVPSGTADVVTNEDHASSGKKVWETIVDDLMPSDASPHKSSRAHFWSEALTEQHEKFHADDFKGWCESTGRADAVSYFNARTVSSSNINGGLGTLLSACRSDFVSKMFEYYFGGPADPGHSARAGEITAYADGKPGYTALAEAVKAHGESLAEAPSTD